MSGRYRITSKSERSKRLAIPSPVKPVPGQRLCFASLVALALQEVYLQFATFMLGYQPPFPHDLTAVHAMEILGTAAMGPLMHLLVQGVENSLHRLGWRPRSDPMPYEPFGE